MTYAGRIQHVYLVLYKVVCTVGCGTVLSLALKEVVSRLLEQWFPGARLATLTASALKWVWKATTLPLVAVQVFMCLDVVHAATTLVPRREMLLALAFTVPRLVVVVLAQNLAFVGHAWPFGMMVLAWATADVFRNAYDVAVEVVVGGPDKAPGWLFRLRHTLFFVLSPVAAVGEVMVMSSTVEYLAQQQFNDTPVRIYGVANVSPFVVMAVVKAGMCASVLGVLFTYVTLIQRRGLAYASRFPPPPPITAAVVRGVVFPPDDTGKPDSRSSLDAGKKVLAAALNAVGSEEATAAAAAVLAEKNFRFGYAAHYEALVRAAVGSKKAAHASAKAGLQWMYDNFEFIADGKAHKVTEALAAKTGAGSSSGAAASTSFHTATIRGSDVDRADFRYVVPYDGPYDPHEDLTAQYPKIQLETVSLNKQLDRWVEKGVMEADAADAVRWTSTHFEEGKHNLRDCYFVLIGASSAMGPFPHLLRHGANVVAVDIPGRWGEAARPTPWHMLIQQAKRSCGTMTFPVNKPQKDCADDAALAAAAGGDLTTEPFDLANWLVKWVATVPADAKVVVGNYTYADGEKHVKVSLCADILIQALRKARPTCAVAFLSTPTDLHVVPELAAYKAKEMYGAGLRWLGTEMFMHIVSRGKWLQPNYLAPAQYKEREDARETVGVHLIDGLVAAQGPNYALAKRIQHWRAVIEYEKGAVVSSLVAPSTATMSVVSNASFKRAYGGMHFYGYEIFKQSTSTAVMAAILIHDVLNPESPKNPKNRSKNQIKSALEITRSEAVHGGLWRSPYKAGSIGAMSVLMYLLQEYSPTAAVTCAFFAVFYNVFQWSLTTQPERGMNDISLTV